LIGGRRCHEHERLRRDSKRDWRHTPEDLAIDSDFDATPADPAQQTHGHTLERKIAHPIVFAQAPKHASERQANQLGGADWLHDHGGESPTLHGLGLLEPYLLQLQSIVADKYRWRAHALAAMVMLDLY
jgi:hypothetical protein